MVHSLQDSSKVVGTKQTLRALEKGIVKVLYIAKDTQKHIISTLLDEVKDKDIEIVYVSTMEELGKICDIEVKTATAALIN